MMETFLVLGLCFILYEALDFFQGCIHSATTNASDQIDEYRRQLEEQRQKQQEEQFLANLTPLLSAQLEAAGFTLSTDPNSTTASTASIISDLKNHVLQQQLLQQQQHLQEQQRQYQHQYQQQRKTQSLSAPILNQNVKVNQISQSTQFMQNSSLSSLPQEYSTLQQQQQQQQQQKYLNNLKNSNKSFISKLSSNSDNRIFPECSNIIRVPTAPNVVINTQPKLQQKHLELSTAANAKIPAIETLSINTVQADKTKDLKRTVITKTNKTHNNNNNNKTNNNNNNKNSNDVQSFSVTLSTQESENLQVDQDDGDDLSSSSTSASLASTSSIINEDTEQNEHNNLDDDHHTLVPDCSKKAKTIERY